MDNVASFLSHGAGQSVSAEEVEGMLAMLPLLRAIWCKLTTYVVSKLDEFFRYFNVFFFLIRRTTGDFQVLLYSKKFPRNPNGVYRWEGVGTAKHTRPRNR